MTHNTLGGRGSIEQCHQFTQGGGRLKLTKKSVTYYLNVPQLALKIICNAFEEEAIHTLLYYERDGEKCSTIKNSDR